MRETYKQYYERNLSLRAEGMLRLVELTIQYRYSVAHVWIVKVIPWDRETTTKAFNCDGEEVWSEETYSV